jgi:hypothetical protein
MGASDSFTYPDSFAARAEESEIPPPAKQNAGCRNNGLVGCGSLFDCLSQFLKVGSKKQSQRRADKSVRPTRPHHTNRLRIGA